MYISQIFSFLFVGVTTHMLDDKFLSRNRIPESVRTEGGSSTTDRVIGFGPRQARDVNETCKTRARPSFGPGSARATRLVHNAAERRVHPANVGR